MFPVVLFFMDFFGKKIRKTGHRIQQATADITSVLQETLSASRVVKSFVGNPMKLPGSNGPTARTSMPT